MIRIGTAGWGRPAAVGHHFPAGGTGLQRYAAVFDAVEINTTFHRPHQPKTYARWAAETPVGFRFAVKAPRTVTHDAKLRDCGALMRAFRAQAEALGPKLGPLLVQLPPKLAFDAQVAAPFFEDLRTVWPQPIVCEPRHETWFTPQAEALLAGHKIARVAADPAPHPAAAHPGGWPGLAYWRLHGSPRMYFTPYGEERLRALAALLAAGQAQETWVMFDNTGSGAAAADALTLKAILGAGSAPP
jgi:uncharacterized protein YecE (DUF72 family)